MNKEISKIITLEENKEIIRLNISSIEDLKNRNEELSLNMNLEGFDINSGYNNKLTIDINNKMINNRIEENKRLYSEIVTLEEEINEMLKYFKKDLNPKTKGLVLKLLSKKYRPFYSIHETKTFSEIINYCIENDLNLELEYKTLKNNILLNWNYDLKTWL